MTRAGMGNRPRVEAVYRVLYPASSGWGGKNKVIERLSKEDVAPDQAEALLSCSVRTGVRSPRPELGCTLNRITTLSPRASCA